MTAATMTSPTNTANSPSPAPPLATPLPLQTTAITPIPLPSDDYDRPHSTHAALSSLHAATTSFDAAMDAIRSKTLEQHRRVLGLEARARRCREWIGRLEALAEKKKNEGGEVDDWVCTVFCPNSYAVALEGMEAVLRDLKGDLKVDGESGDADEARRVFRERLSASDCARTAADAAVRASLRHDALTDDGEAVPSDAWLDHASMGVGLGRALRVSEGQRRIPRLFSAIMSSAGNAGGGGCMEETEYRAILDSLAMSSSGPAAAPGSLAGLAGKAGSGGPPAGAGVDGGGDDESVHSTNSRISALSMSSQSAPVASTSGRMTAAQRRRWHQQQQQQQQLKNMQAGQQIVPTGAASVESGGASTTVSDTANTTSSPKNNTDTAPKPNPKKVTIAPVATVMQPLPPVTTQFTSVSGRQQSYTGSQPYLCEVLHDSYGIGTHPPKGLLACSGFSSRGLGSARGGGTELYPPPSSVADLVVFNTSRESYGLAKRRAAAVAAAAQSSTGKGGKSDGMAPAKTTTASRVGSGTPIDGSASSVTLKKRESGSGVDAMSSNLAKLVFVPDEAAAGAAGAAVAVAPLDLPDSLPVESG
ncbi:hypothetical protein ACHAXS_011464 [Conticribra weissflogii]